MTPVDRGRMFDEVPMDHPDPTAQFGGLPVTDQYRRLHSLRMTAEQRQELHATEAGRRATGEANRRTNGPCPICLKYMCPGGHQDCSPTARRDDTTTRRAEQPACARCQQPLLAQGAWLCPPCADQLGHHDIIAELHREISELELAGAGAALHRVWEYQP